MAPKKKETTNAMPEPGHEMTFPPAKGKKPAAKKAGKAKMKVCPECGAKNPANKRKCMKCGASLAVK